jgi:hypothetical protein
MAHIERRRTKDGGSRYEVRWRASGRERSKSFDRRKDADSFKAKIEGDELVGLVSDPSVGKVTFAAYAQGWLASRVVKGRPAHRPTTATNASSSATSCRAWAPCRFGL